jgi:hypothetical protein
MNKMNPMAAISLTTLTALTTLQAFPAPARASFGDFMLGAGAAAGTALLINNNRKNSEAKKQAVTPEQERYRGIQDGTNGLKYDNPRDSADYDKGYEEGIRRRNASGK